MPSCKFHRSFPTHKTALACTSLMLHSKEYLKHSMHFPVINPADSDIYILYQFPKQSNYSAN